MSFAVSAEAYAAFMGRFSEPLAPLFADLARAGIGGGQRVLDVGCGPGALTAELARRLGPAAVWAVEPSESFARAAASRPPGSAGPPPSTCRSPTTSSIWPPLSSSCTS